MPLIDPSAPGAHAVRPRRHKATRHKTIHEHADDEVRRLVVQPNPDQRERRSPAQRAHDAEYTADVIREMRRQAIIHHRQRVGRAIVTGRTLPPSITGLRTPRPLSSSRDLPTLQELAAARRETRAARVAPVLTVLEQTTRPLHAIANETLSDIKRGGVGEVFAVHAPGSAAAAQRRRALVRGIENKDKTTFSDVLQAAGVHNKALAGALGFGLDVVADPLTYTSGGLGSVGERAAVKAAQRAASKARAAGLADDQVERFATRAYTQAARSAGSSRGLSLRFGGVEAPGVRRGTAAAGRAAQRGVEAVAPARATRNLLRHLAADVNPNVVPDNLDRATYEAVRSATRSARSSASRGVYKARQAAGAVNKAIGPENFRLVIDAIERGRIGDLPAELQRPARFLRDQFKYARRVEKRAGIRGATRANYVPHLRADLTEEGAGIGQRSVGARQIRPSSSMARKDTRTLAQIRQTDPGKYIEDPGVVFAARMQESAMARARAELNRRLGDLGRRIPRGRSVDLRDGEAVYHIKGSDIRKLDLRKADDARELQAFADGSAAKGGQYVALNEQAVDRALKRITPSGDRSTAGVIFDRGQGVWKLLATQPNPGFHVRNFVGDLQNAFLGQPGHSLPANIVHSARALTALGRHEQAMKTLDRRIDPSGKGLPIDGAHMTYAELALEAEGVGGVRSGFVSRELGDLLSGQAKAGVRFDAVRRWANNREDVMRLATYIGARRRGMTAEQAAARVAKYHFDYSDLTELERRVFRRVMPFYTFSARNIPLQFKALLSRPGKYAQYEKVREEVAKAFGFQDGWEGDLSEREQRAAPLIVRIGGRPVTISLGPGGLPLTDLNEFPTTTNPSKQADEWLEKAISMVTPALKTPVELWANMSFFFRDAIEKPEGPLVPAPVWVKRIPAKYREQLGIVPDYVDKRTGKKEWGWPGKVGYAFGVLPGPVSFLNRLLTPSEKQDWKAKTLGYIGVRALPVDATTTKIDNLYAERDEVDKAMRALNQRGVNAANPTREYVRLSAREKDITGHIMALRHQRGDVILPGQRVRKPQPSTPLTGVQKRQQDLLEAAAERSSAGGLSDKQLELLEAAALRGTGG